MFVYTSLRGLSVFCRAIKLSQRGHLWVDTPQRGNLWQPYFPEVAASGQIRETLRSLLSSSVDSQLSSAQNSFMSKVAYLGVRHPDSLQVQLLLQRGVKADVFYGFLKIKIPVT